jgi:dipeptide/tripeptide permease
MENQFPPDPPDAVGRPSKLKGTAGFIIVTEFCERLAYYGFAGSLVLFFQVKTALLPLISKFF